MLLTAALAVLLAAPPAVAGGSWLEPVQEDLQPGDTERLRERYLALQERKRLQQPTGARNSGCVFRNPAQGRAAGQLLEESGCMGLRVGGAEISAVHANFIVNRGTATTADVLALIEAVRARVEAHSGVALSPEIYRW